MAITVQADIQFLSQHLTVAEISRAAQVTERMVYNWKSAPPGRETKGVRIIGNLAKQLRQSDPVNWKLLRSCIGSNDIYQKYLDKLLRGRVSARSTSERVIQGVPWEVAFFEFVDDLRATGHPDLISDPPCNILEYRLLSLLSSITHKVCNDLGINPPGWATQKRVLQNPWFVSSMNSMQAFELSESPAEFKMNNIFITKEFLSRA